MLIKLKMPYRNSCSKCGKILVQGEECYAENQDEVLAGKAVCKSCAFPKKGKAEVVEQEAEE